MRISIALIGFVSAIAGMPWLTALCILALSVRYRAWEVVLLGLFMDFMWLPTDVSLYSFPYFTLGSIVIAWLFEPLRIQFLR